MAAPPPENAFLQLRPEEIQLINPDIYTNSLSGAHTNTISRVTVITGHITAAKQERCINEANGCQLKFNEFVQWLKDHNPRLLARDLGDAPLSHLYCPFIWRILSIAKASGRHPAIQDIPRAWLTYGPRGAGLYRIIGCPQREGGVGLALPNGYGNGLSPHDLYEKADVIAKLDECVSAVVRGYGDGRVQVGGDRAVETIYGIVTGAAGPEVADQENNSNLGGGARYRSKTYRIKRRRSHLLSRRR
jgi:hypothetical protein